VSAGGGHLHQAIKKMIQIRAKSPRSNRRSAGKGPDDGAATGRQAVKPVGQLRPQTPADPVSDHTAADAFADNQTDYRSVTRQSAVQMHHQVTAPRPNARSDHRGEVGRAPQPIR
jgi:hypothetical protein